MRGTIVVGVLALHAAGCEPLERLDGGPAASVPAAVQEIFDARCNQVGCHGGGSVAVGLDLTAAHSAEILGRAATQAAMPLVERGNVEGSYLAQKLVASPSTPIAGTRMPPGAAFDDPALAQDLAVLLGWIAGADLPGGDSGGSSSGGGGDTSPDEGGSVSTTSATTSTTDPTAADSGETGAVPGQLCGTEDLKPGAPNPIVSGTGAMQLPPAIGDILAANCGCHYADDLAVGPPLIDYPSALPFVIATWSDWQGTIGAKTVLQSCRDRLQVDAAAPMPPAACDVGGGESMDPGQRASLLEWIDAGGPDGANWP